MSFDATARQRVAPGAEKQDVPACLPLVSVSTGHERAVMRFEQFEIKVIKETDEVCIQQDAEVDAMVGPASVVLTLEQIDVFIDVLRRAVRDAGVK